MSKSKQELINQRLASFTSQLSPVAPDKTYMKRASERLREELLKPQSQQLWTRYISHRIATDKSVLSYRAISRAMSAAENERYGINVPPNRYKDRVRRAILGERMTLETLRLFADTFSFSTEAVNYISTLLAQTQNLENLPTEKRIPRFDVTTTFYDIYVNKHHQIYKMRCNLVFRALEDSCNYYWAPLGPEIEKVEVHSGATLKWHETFNMHYFQLNSPLDTSESGSIDYTMHLKDGADADTDESILVLQYGKARSNVFYRFFFDEDPATTEILKCTRTSIAESEQDSEVSFDLLIHQKRVSLFLERVEKEIVMFEL